MREVSELSMPSILQSVADPHNRPPGVSWPATATPGDVRPRGARNPAWPSHRWGDRELYREVISIAITRDENGKREIQAGMPAVSRPVSEVSSGPSERRSVSGGDSAETAANMSASTGGAARLVWCSD